MTSVFRACHQLSEVDSDTLALSSSGTPELALLPIPLSSYGNTQKLDRIGLNCQIFLIRNVNICSVNLQKITSHTLPDVFCRFEGKCIGSGASIVMRRYTEAERRSRYSHARTL